MLFWLLSLADELPSLILGLIIVVVDMAAYCEFMHSSIDIFSRCTLTLVVLDFDSSPHFASASILMLSQKVSNDCCSFDD